MFEVWKYDLGTGINYISMPGGAKPLSVHMREGLPRMWALVNPENTSVSHKVLCVETGDKFKEVGQHIGTLLMDDDRLVFHFFYLGEVDEDDVLR